MKAQISHDVFSSFYLWFENELISDKLKAYIPNKANSFEYAQFQDLPETHYGYQGKFRQLVPNYDIDVPNSGIFVNGDFISGDSNEFYIDYKRGRIIVPADSGSVLEITANQTVKEINLYVTEDDETNILVTSDFVDIDNDISTYYSDKERYRDDDFYILPACFLKLEGIENKLFSFGGEYDTRFTLKVFVLAFSNYQIDAIMSHFSDKIHSCFPIVPHDEYPYGTSDIIKDYPYVYNDYTFNYTKKAFIENVRTSRVTSSLSLEKIQKNVLLAYLYFDISLCRYPKI